MKKTIIRSTFLLIVVSILAKALSFCVRIILARTLSEEAMNYYTLSTPTMVIVITLAQMGIPTALSKLIAQGNHPKKHVVASTLLSLLNNLVIVLALMFILPLLSIYVLKQTEILPVLFAILPLIPLVSVSGLLKGYLYGIQHHIQATSTQVFEETARILFLFFAFSMHTNMDAVSMAKIAMLSVSVGELCSALYLIFSVKINTHALLRIPQILSNLHRQQFHEVLCISIPMTGSRLIGSLTYFIEPIVMVIGLSILEAQTMVSAYGQLNGYVLPIITMPSFITITLSNFLLPSFTYHYTRHHTAYAKKLFTIIISCCLLVGMSCSLLCYFFSEELLFLFYKNTRGALLLKQLAFPFALYSLQPPLSSMLHALSLSKKSVADTFFGSTTRILCVLLLTPIVLTNALPIGLTLGMLVTTLLHALRLAFIFHKKNKT